MACLLTEIENNKKQRATSLLKELFPHTGKALVIGVTGSSGVGKSTLVNGLAHYYSRAGEKVGVIAVDPSSPFSGGAILGDRIRMQSLATDPNVFVRSMATRGKMGGLSSAVDEALLVLDAAGYKILIVETVGVGQDEVDIIKTSHVTLVLLAPGMGDDVQNVKAGIMEIGDIFVVNKSDKDGFSGMEQDLKALFSLSPREDGWTPPVLKTVATRNEGLPELVEALSKYRKFLSSSEKSKQRQIFFFQNKIIDFLRERLEEEILAKIPEKKLNSYAEKMMTRELDPYTLVNLLLEEIGFLEVSNR